MLTMKTCVTSALPGRLQTCDTCGSDVYKHADNKHFSAWRDALPGVPVVLLLPVLLHPEKVRSSQSNTLSHSAEEAGEVLSLEGKVCLDVGATMQEGLPLRLLTIL